MALILNIDSAQEQASVCLAKGSKILLELSNDNQQDHASWLHVAIADIMNRTGYVMNDLDAIAVSNGPGSYTGLRVGLAAAKGICYALNKPLIAVNTLETMALSVQSEASDLICPLIDARRMEVFTAVYDKSLTILSGPRSLVVDFTSFGEFLSNHNIIFCGSGVEKLKHILIHTNATFSSTKTTSKYLAELGLEYYKQQRFADLAYTEPFYLKEVYTNTKSL